MEAIGNLGKDATKNNVNGKNVINFSIAHTEKYNNAKGELVSKTLWVECAYWTDKDGVLPYLLKGTQVWVTGSPDVRSWSDKDGKPGISLTLRVQQVQLLGSAEKKTEVKEQTGNDAGTSPHPLAGPHPLGGNTVPAPVTSQAWNGNPDDLPF